MKLAPVVLNMYLWLLTAISWKKENYRNIYLFTHLLILIKWNKNAVIWHISQNNGEEHGFTVNLYQNYFKVGSCHKLILKSFTVKPIFSQLSCFKYNFNVFVSFL